MKKIPTLYVRDENDRRYVTDVVNPGCEWVLAGEGIPTRKYDGTCVMFDGTDWWARREVKPGRPEPDGFVVEQFDDATGKAVGWEPMAQSPFFKFWNEAVGGDEAVGTYELVGPKINGNPEDMFTHVLIPHAGAGLVGHALDAPSVLINACREQGWEGIVWHHPDGRMAKLKVRDYPHSRDGEPS